MIMDRRVRTGACIEEATIVLEAETSHFYGGLL